MLRSKFFVIVVFAAELIFFSKAMKTSKIMAQGVMSSRVQEAMKEKGEAINKMFKRAGIAYPPRKIYIRIFKKERVVELWAEGEENEKFTFIKSYTICRTSGTAGPKRMEGDGQIPEGFYHIAGFNPHSRFYLSLKINYPNASDKILGAKGKPGGNIFIHGNCVTIGCVPITDEQIKELYVIALDARANGQKKIPVHIFPSQMDKNGMEWLKTHAVPDPDDALWNFWMNIKDGYDYFETHHTVPKISVDSHGKYIFKKYLK